MLCIHANDILLNFKRNLRDLESVLWSSRRCPSFSSLPPCPYPSVCALRWWTFLISKILSSIIAQHNALHVFYFGVKWNIRNSFCVMGNRRVRSYQINLSTCASGFEKDTWLSKSFANSLFLCICFKINLLETEK